MNLVKSDKTGISKGAGFWIWPTEGLASMLWTYIKDWGCLWGPKDCARSRL